MSCQGSSRRKSASLILTRALECPRDLPLHFFVRFFGGAALTRRPSTQKQHERDRSDYGQSTDPQPQGPAIRRSYALGFLAPEQCPHPSQSTEGRPHGFAALEVPPSDPSPHAFASFNRLPTYETANGHNRLHPAGYKGRIFPREASIILVTKLTRKRLLGHPPLAGVPCLQLSLRGYTLF